MTFDHVKTEWQPRVVIDNILRLDEQAANHRVDPEAIIAFNDERLDAAEGAPVRPRVPGRARNGSSSRKRVQRLPRPEARAGRHRLRRPDHAGAEDGRRAPAGGADYRERFGAVLLDEYQDTNVAQAELIAGRVRRRLPVTAVGDPDQNIYAWRGASLFNLMEFPRQFPRADGQPAARLPLYTNFRSGARILARGRHDDRAAPRRATARSRQGAAPWPPNGDGEVRRRRASRRVGRGGVDRERIVGAPRRAAAAWSDVAVLCRKSRLFDPLQLAFAERDVPVEFVGLAGLLKMPEVVEVLAYARAVANPPASGSPGSCSARATAWASRIWPGGARWAKISNHVLREEDDDEARAVPVRGGARAPRRGRGTLGRGTARLEEFRDELARAARRGPGARRRVPGGGHPAHRHARRAGRGTGPGARADAAKRNLAAFLDQVHAFEPVEGELTLRAFLDYIDPVEAQREAGVVAGPAERRGLGQGHDDPPAKGLEFDHVFVPGLATGLLPDPMIQHNPAERGKSMDFELRGDAAILPTFDGCLRSSRGPAGAGDDRGTPHAVRRADACPASACS